MREAYRTADRFVTSLFSPSRQRQVRIALACAAFVAAATVCKAATPSPGLAADGWITHPGAMPSAAISRAVRIPVSGISRSSDQTACSTAGINERGSTVVRTTALSQGQGDWL
jgi:hypothetical protein